MNDSRLDDLIQGVLEGAATGDERERLERRLAGDAQARARHEQLSSVFRALGEARLEEPPAGLRDAIMREVRVRHAASPARPLRPAWRLALPLAAGIAAVVIAIVALSGGLGQGPGRERASGALASPGAPARVLALGAGGARVAVSAEGDRDGRPVLVFVAGDEPVRLRVWGDPAAVALAPAESRRGVSLEAAQPGLVNASLVAGGALRVRCDARTNDAVVRVSARFADGSNAEGSVPLSRMTGTRQPR